MFLRLRPTRCLLPLVSSAAAMAQAPLPLPAADPASRSLPVELTAREIRGRIGEEAIASGDVQLRQGGLVLSADTLSYVEQTRLVKARGNIALQRAGDRFSGSELQLQLDTQQGYILDLTYQLQAVGAGGSAERVDFLGHNRYTVASASYTSCPRDGSGDPDWLLRADHLEIDLDNNEAVAQGAVLRFLGVPILALPALSFPVTSDRKSGWLPPSLNLDSSSGVEVAVPYYWNLAPNRDFTFTPSLMTRRGAGFEAQFRYLEPSDEGRIELHSLPQDRSTDDSRYSVDLAHRGRWGADTFYSAVWQDASDDAYWKDFPRMLPSLTQRLLPLDLRLDHAWRPGGADLGLYARVQRWSVLQDLTEPITPPFQRSPQLGVRGQGAMAYGIGYAFETEVNRFELRDEMPGDPRGDGERAHISAALMRRFDAPWGWLLPRLSANGATYATDEPMSDGRKSASRAVPTASLDGGLLYERDTALFGRGVRQTLEPRALYVRTPVRAQSTLPAFDLGGNIDATSGRFVPSGKDFNEVSIYSENDFSGIDRISDANRLTFGATSRVFDAENGMELLRMGFAQRVQFSEQELTPDDLPSTNRFSDLLLFGSTTLVPNWTLDATLQFNAEIGRSARSILGARYHPAEFHTVSGIYRYARGLNEQFELGWQWPVYRSEKKADNGCGGSLYGVGRVNYSMRDARFTDSLVGLEYDAGCWIGRVVAERISTGREEATTRLMLQLELVGLSRLGTNPLQTLKDNIPGYRLLREDAAEPPPPVYP